MRVNREAAISLLIAAGLLAAPLLGNAFDEPFVITLATKVAILGLAGTGLNIALGYGGMVSLGHAAFFGLGWLRGRHPREPRAQLRAALHRAAAGRRHDADAHHLASRHRRQRRGGTW